MDEETEIITQLMETMASAIVAGDWKVDGANDPDMAMRRAAAYLEQRGYQGDGVYRGAHGGNQDSRKTARIV